MHQPFVTPVPLVPIKVANKLASTEHWDLDK